MNEDTRRITAQRQPGHTAAGNAAIGNFDVAHDMLQLSRSVYADVAAAIAAIQADAHNAGAPADTYIALDPLHAVTLTGVNPTQLVTRVRDEAR